MGGGGGGSGGGAFVNRTPDHLRNIVRKAEEETSIAAFESQLATTLGGLLGQYNARDTPTVQRRLNELKKALQGNLKGSFDQLYGGSVAKHTYVDGMSDVDSLIMINGSAFEGKSPAKVLERMANMFSRSLGNEASVTHGRIAVTVIYTDQMIIQVLPALQSPDGKVKVPSFIKEGWAGIEPLKFQRKLTERNNACNGKLIPTIKLAKAVIAQLPESQRLSGYHVESIAISAFKDYTGPKTTSSMLPMFFERAKSLVLDPVKDSTGQSVYVDAYLGGSGSAARQTASHLLDRIARRMRNATAAGSAALWKSLFGLEE